MSKVLEHLDKNEKNDNTMNDWGETHPAGIKLYNLDGDSDLDDEFKPHRKPQKKDKDKSPTNVVAEELEKMSKEENKSSNDRAEKTQRQGTDVLKTNLNESEDRNVSNGNEQITKRLETIENKIATLEEKSSATLNKMDELLSSLKQIINDEAIITKL